MKIAIFGAGQLAMMMIQSDKNHEHEFVVIDPSSKPPASNYAQHIQTDYADPNTLEKIKTDYDIATIDFENVDVDNKWKKITIGVSYNQSKNNFNEFSIFNANNNNSIDSYFLNNAEGLRLDQISAFEGESITNAYVDIGNTYGYAHQQAFLGYESFIIDPLEFTCLLYTSPSPRDS